MLSLRFQIRKLMKAGKTDGEIIQILSDSGESEFGFGNTKQRYQFPPRVEKPAEMYNKRFKLPMRKEKGKGGSNRDRQQGHYFSD